MTGKRERDVNLWIDKRVSLIDIIELDSGEQGKRRVCALAIDDKAPVVKDLLYFKKARPEDFKKLQRILDYLSDRTVIVGMHIKQGKGQRSDIWEVRAGQIRVFFFVSDNDEIVICTNTYWKAKSSRQEQDAAFAVAQKMKQVYESWQK